MHKIFRYTIKIKKVLKILTTLRKEKRLPHMGVMSLKLGAILENPNIINPTVYNFKNQYVGVIKGIKKDGTIVVINDLKHWWRKPSGTYVGKYDSRYYNDLFVTINEYDSKIFKY
jgi:hypothetical protein